MFMSLVESAPLSSSLARRMLSFSRGLLLQPLALRALLPPQGASLLLTGFTERTLLPIGLVLLVRVHDGLSHHTKEKEQMFDGPGAIARALGSPASRPHEAPPLHSRWKSPPGAPPVRQFVVEQEERFDSGDAVRALVVVPPEQGLPRGRLQLDPWQRR